jgi:hypothetical protein
MIRGRDVRAGLRAGGVWLLASLVLIAIGRVSGDGWESLVGGLLVPFGLLGAPGQVAVAWGTFQKPAAGLNGFVAGSLAGLGNALALVLIGVPFTARQLNSGSFAQVAQEAPFMAYSPLVLVFYTLGILCFLFTIYTSVTLAIVEAPAADEL